MATYYISKQAGASNSNTGTQASPFLTIAKGISTMAAGDTLLLRGGDTFPESISPPNAKSGTALAPTTIGSYTGPLGQRMAKVTTNGSSPCIGFFPGPVSYYTFQDLDLSTTNFTAGGGTAIAGEHIVETPSGGSGAAFHITFKRCYLHDTMNCCVQSYNGPTPRSSGGLGSGTGDDSDWLFQDCEFARAGNSLLIFHGSRLTMDNCHLHCWGESSNSFGKHGIYLHSINAVIKNSYFHNDDATSPGQGDGISQRVTGLTASRNLFHDCQPIAVFWYDNVAGQTIYFGNRGWNLYSQPFYFDATNDTGPTYTWGPNPVDEFIYASNVWHMRASQTQAFAAQSAAAAYIGGLTIANNIVLGGYSKGIDFGSHGFTLNHGITGQLLEKNNIWNPTGSLSFQFSGTNYASLAAWQGATVGGHTQGVGSLSAAPSLGLAPAGDSRRAPTPFMINGVDQTQADNSLVGSTQGAPDYFPQGGSNNINAGTTSVSGITYTG